MQITVSLLFSHTIALTASAAPLYKWVEEDGQIRYSDNLPAGQSSKSFQTITPEGRVLSTKEKSKSPEELRQERADNKRREEENRINAEIAARLAAIKEHHDNVLLMTFTNENEILEAQDERLAVIDSVIKLLKKNIITEQNKLNEEEKRAKQLYLDKNLRIPGGQAQKIEYFTEKVLSKQQHLSLKIAEREKVKQQYIQDLIRYRELVILKKQQDEAEAAEKARLKEESYYK